EEDEGLLDVLGGSTITPLTRQGYDIAGGTSYLQLVSFDDDGPRARGLLVHGQSAQPGSPWSFDQLPAYAAGQWFDLPFQPEDVAAQRVGEPLTLRFSSGMGEAGGARGHWQPQ